MIVPHREYGHHPDVRSTGHACRCCHTLVDPQSAKCEQCGIVRPENGWDTTQDLADPWLGRIINDRFVLDRRLGVGASGSVYRAQARFISRTFALKLIDVGADATGLDPGHVMKRLNREIDALSRIRNPHVVSIYDVFEATPTHVGVVMDYVEGETLTSIVRDEGALAVRRAANLTRQLANGMYEAHHRDLVHRDLKPENIMVELLPAGDEFLQILDFGIVWAKEHSRLTDGFIGTPLFASPEQALGDDIDHRSDIYSIGAILYFMLAGSPPFDGPNVHAILRNHVNRPLPSLTEVSGTEFPPVLESIITRMMAKNPEHRPDSLTEVIRCIDELPRDTLNFDSSASSSSDQLPLSDQISDQTGPLSQDDIATVSGRPRPPEHVVVAEDLLSFVKDAGIVTVDLNAGREIFHPVAPGVRPTVSYPIGGLLLVGTADGRVGWLDAEGAIELLFRNPLRERITAVAGDRGGRVLVAATESGRVYLHHAKNSSDLWSRAGTSDGSVRRLAVDPEGARFAVARDGGSVEIFDAESSRRASGNVEFEGRRARSMTFSPDGYLLAILDTDGTVHIKNAYDGRTVSKMSPRHPMVAIAIDHDSSLLGVGADGTGLHTYDLQTGVRRDLPYNGPHSESLSEVSSVGFAG